MKHLKQHLIHFKRKNNSSLWVVFAVFVFFIIFISYTILLVLYYLMYQIRFPVTLQLALYEPPLALFFLISVVIVMSISILAGKQVFGPVGEISHALTKVAKGDFSVNLKYTGFVGELSEMCANFNVMTRELGHMETLRSDFVTSVSHEFKTPLAAIEGCATILQNPDLNDFEVREYARKISESTRQLAKLSSNVLMISNLENREIITEMTEFRLDEQIRQAILFLEPLWESKSINMSIDLDYEIFYGNEELLMQIWLNLIGNAIKFTPKNGEVSVSLKHSQKDVSVTVSDTGIGMSAEVRHHIFDKFYQADRSGYTDGNGLGLSLVKRIVDLCRGEITVQSEPGEGSSFVILLPVLPKPDGSGADFF